MCLILYKCIEFVLLKTFLLDIIEEYFIKSKRSKMKKLTDFIVDHCFIVLFIVVLIAGASAFIAKNVKINHDIMEYMPESSETSQGLKVMDEEFKDVTTSGYMMMFENLAEEN